MGYRWYDAQQDRAPVPVWPRFVLHDFRSVQPRRDAEVSDGTQPIKVALDVQNTGDVAGAEVAQMYLQLPSCGE